LQAAVLQKTLALAVEVDSQVAADILAALVALLAQAAVQVWREAQVTLELAVAAAETAAATQVQANQVGLAVQVVAA
jgi:hypothetical protein